MPQTQLLALLLLLVLGAGIALFFLRKQCQRPVRLARRLASEVRTIAAAHAGHRIALSQLPSGFRELATAINDLAARYERLLTTQQQAVAQARSDLATEHARLITLIQNLAEGVLVCNAQGEILLYNRHAQALLGAQVGLGRVITRVLGNPMEQTWALMQQQKDRRVRRFIIRTRQGHFLRVRVTPIYENGADLQGAVLTLEDMTAQIENEERQDALIRELDSSLRGGLANIRAAIETLRAYPEMTPETRQKLEGVISEEVERLGQQLQETLAEYQSILRAVWRLENMPLKDILLLLTQQLRLTTPEIPPELASAWMRVEPHGWLRALTQVIRTMPGTPTLRLATRDTHLLWIFAWPSQAVSENQLCERVHQGQDHDPSLAQVMQHHDGEAWVQQEEGEVQLVLLMPLASPQEPVQPPPSQATIAPRPEYYDFDLLFRRPEPAATLDATPLRQLQYTVFDTETTGLDPVGDELIAIGAVRIVNARLLEEERFYHLIKPRRPIPPSATRIHGIRNQDVQDAPPLEKVLPAFHAFVGDSILVAHNAAFDMRFLEEVEKRTGVRFTQPVLDTLLLSAIVHPEHRDHSVEAIAARLGVEVQARHSALGDALTTARIFLKLIPLLEHQGILTLAQARAASEQTYFARIRY